MKWLTTPFVNLAKRLTHYRNKERVEFSFWWFTFFVAMQSAIYIFALYKVTGIISPELQATQFSASPFALIGCFLTFHMGNCFFEFFFHRYVLHAVVWKILATFMRKHEEHHSLTHVKQAPDPTSKSAGKVIVVNKYPITIFEQIKSSAFPAYSLIVFVVIFELLATLLQLLWPSLPWLLAGLLAVIWSFWLYEVLHALWHLDPERSWFVWMKNRKFGYLIQRIYGFHLIHHTNRKSNMAISGFFGFPVADWALGTLYIPKVLPMKHGMEMELEKYPSPPPPCKLIVWLDRVVKKRTSRNRRSSAAS